MSLTIKEIEVKSVMTKSNLPVADFSVNPYVGCTHGCKYCYASFMKRFTNHPEPWGEFIDVKYWPEMPYLRDNDQHRSAFGEPPVVVNYFYHEEVKKSAKKVKE